MEKHEGEECKVDQLPPGVRQPLGDRLIADFVRMEAGITDDVVRHPDMGEHSRNQKKAREALEEPAYQATRTETAIDAHFTTSPS